MDVVLDTPGSGVVAALATAPAATGRGSPRGASAGRCRLQPRPELGFRRRDDSRAESKEPLSGLVPAAAGGLRTPAGRQFWGVQVCCGAVSRLQSSHCFLQQQDLDLLHS